VKLPVVQAAPEVQMNFLKFCQQLCLSVCAYRVLLKLYVCNLVVTFVFKSSSRALCSAFAG
jgi:hypothetical protein